MAYSQFTPYTQPYGQPAPAMQGLEHRGGNQESTSVVLDASLGAIGRALTGGGGLKSSGLKDQARRRNGLIMTCQCLFGPWLMFAVLNAVMSFDVRYNHPWVTWSVCLVCVAITASTGYTAYQAFKRRRDALTPDALHPLHSADAHHDADAHHHWYIFSFVSFAIVLLAAVFFGDLNYWYNFQPYNDILNLQIYNNVDPSVAHGERYMDAGQVVFQPGSQLDASKSLGFKNVEWYCAAPIVKGNAKPTSYDFWAVGLNCCSGVAGDYRCGEWSNIKAHAGLRLMRDDLRPFFRLAVQEAEAQWGIKAEHPVFFYWLQDPLGELNSYRSDGLKYYFLGVFTYFGFNLFLVVLATILFSKAAERAHHEKEQLMSQEHSKVLAQHIRHVQTTGHTRHVPLQMSPGQQAPAAPLL